MSDPRPGKKEQSVPPGENPATRALPARHPDGLGSRIKRLRRARGMTQGDFAKRIAVSPASLSGWELDRVRPSVERLRKIAQALGISHAELLGLDDGAGLQMQIQSVRKTIARTAGVSEDRVRIQIRM